MKLSTRTELPDPEALDRLTDRELLALYDREGLSYRRIGRRYGLTGMAIFYRIRAARERLQGQEP